ncbi:hypothetical protein AB0D09_28480 [Streptomyces sp. NPDC049097]|uniref:hypothetical protein n=1 Tax=Streptomyces sp. NPDC049097 TaxID=3155497 RepID=UPI00341220D5
MTNGTARPMERTAGAKTVLRVYTVTRAGTVTPPHAIATVPHGFKPTRTSPNAHPPLWVCPVHRTAGPAR